MLYFNHMNFSWKKLVAVVGLLAITGQGCTKALPQATVAASKPVTLRIWGVVDDFNVYQPAIDAWRKIHPNVTIDYRRFRLEEYENALLNGFAEDKGPDVFLIHNDWTGEYLSKITPMPKQTSTAYRVTTGGVRPQLTWELRVEPTMPLTEIKNQFADTIARDLVRVVNVGTTDKPVNEERAMGVPVGIDTLALYYNKDLLNAANIPTPPEDWGQFAEQAKTLTQIDTEGKLVRTAAGIGTAANVERSVDIIAALMMQNGSVMADDAGYPTFDRIPSTAAGAEFPPAYRALEFYTDFSNPNKESYTWDATQPNSYDAFIQGKTAFFFGYAYHGDLIRARAPRLNLGITKLPQIGGRTPVNIANYWYFAVAKKSVSQDLSWSLLTHLGKADQQKAMLAVAKRPASRKSLLTEQLNDERIGVFASQVLTSTNWYRGKNVSSAEEALRLMVDDVVAGRLPINQSVKRAADTISQTIQ